MSQTISEETFDALPQHFQIFEDGGFKILVKDANENDAEKLVYRIDLSGVKREERRWEIMDYINEYKGLHLLPCMVKFGESYSDDWTYYVVQGNIVHGTLQQVWKSVTCSGAIIGEDKLKSWMCQVLLALQGLHRRKIIHGSVMADNVFMCENKHHVRLGPTNEFLHIYEHPEKVYKQISSFKTARATDSRGGSDRFVTAVAGLDGLEYIAPEMFNPTGEIAASNDIWGLGTMMYKLATGRPPFSGNTPVAIVMSIERNEPDFSRFLHRGYSREFIDIVSKLLEKDCKKRPSASDFLKMDYFPSNHNYGT